MKEALKNEIRRMATKTIFNPNVDLLDDEDWLRLINVFKFDYERYYSEPMDCNKIKYFPGLVATLFYRISRELFLKEDEVNALEISATGFSLSSLELYYSANIGKGLKINHGLGTVIGSRTIVGENVLLHHQVTIGSKDGGRARLGNNVIVYPGSIIVGEIYIGDNSIIGANVFVDRDYPENSKIL